MDPISKTQISLESQPSPAPSNSLESLAAPAALVHRNEKIALEKSDKHFTLRVNVHNGVVNTIELELKHNGETLISYTADGAQPLWFSEKLLQLLINQTGEFTASSLSQLWDELLSATHLIWRVESPLGASHEALVQSRTPSVFPSVEEFAKNPSLAEDIFIAQRNELSTSTAFVGRARPEESLAMLVISQLPLYSSEPEIRCVTIPIYPGCLTKSDVDYPAPRDILAELKGKLLTEGSQSFLAMLDSPQIKALATEPSEQIKAQQEKALAIYRTINEPELEWPGNGAITGVSLYLGVQRALLRVEVDSCVGEIPVFIGFRCNSPYRCLTAAQLAFLTSQGKLLAEGDQRTRLAVVQRFTNPSARARFLGDPRTAERDMSKEPAASLANLTCSVGSSELFLPQILGRSLWEQLSGLHGITICHQSIARGLAFSEILQGTQALEVTLSGKAKERNPELWHSMRIALKRHGAWALTAVNGMGGTLDLQVGGPDMPDLLPFHEVALDLLRAFSRQSTLGETAFRSELLTIEEAQENAQIPGLGALQVTDVPSLLDRTGLITHHYAGRLLAQLTGINNRIASIVGTYEAIDVGLGCLSIHSTTSPYGVKFWFSDGTISALEFGTSASSNPQTEAWSKLVRLQNLGFRLGSAECRSLEESVGRYLSQHQVKLRPDSPFTSVAALASPLIRDLLNQLELIFPQGLHREKRHPNCWIIEPKEPGAATTTILEQSPE